MSVRVYTGPRPDKRHGPAGHAWARAVPWVLLLATIGVQIAWPLVDGVALARLTVVTVVLFFLTSATHALVHRGFAFTVGWAAISLSLGWFAEWVGLRTGWPFSDYTYGDELGWSLGGVPLVVPLAWAMMSYPTLVVARALCRRWWSVALVGAFALAAWDLFLDPQMVGAGYWTWADPFPAVPGIPDVPLQNLGGWFVVGLVMVLLLDRLPRRRVTEAVPGTLFVWTWLGGVVANALFLDRPAVAVWGGVAMGLVAVPYLVVSWSRRG